MLQLSPNLFDYLTRPQEMQNQENHLKNIQEMPRRPKGPQDFGGIEDAPPKEVKRVDHEASGEPHDTEWDGHQIRNPSVPAVIEKFSQG